MLALPFVGLPSRHVGPDQTMSLPLLHISVGLTTLIAYDLSCSSLVPSERVVPLVVGDICASMGGSEPSSPLLLHASDLLIISSFYSIVILMIEERKNIIFNV